MGRRQEQHARRPWPGTSASRYEVKPRTVRIGERTSKGYSRSDLVSPWSRCVPDVTDVTQTGKDGPGLSAAHGERHKRRRDTGRGRAGAGMRLPGRHQDERRRGSSAGGRSHSPRPQGRTPPGGRAAEGITAGPRSFRFPPEIL